MIRVDGILYNMRDLIWIYHYNQLPIGRLIYVDGNSRNNRIENIKPLKKVEQRIHEFHNPPVVSFL
jgi:hypothetical protein